MTPRERMATRLLEQATAHVDTAVAEARGVLGLDLLRDAWLAGYAAGAAQTVATMQQAVSLMHVPPEGRA